MPASTIRPAREDDAPALAGLMRSLAEQQQDDPIDVDVDRLKHHLFGPRPAKEVLVAQTDDGGLVGYASFLPSYEGSVTQAGLYLADLYVAPDARRHGLGRRLVAAVAGIARTRGLTYLGWLSKDWNVEARAFYAALGAIEAPVVAHAVFGPAFERLAAEALPSVEQHPRD